MFKTIEMIKIKHFINEGDLRRFLYGRKGKANSLNIIFHGEYRDLDIKKLNLNLFDSISLPFVLRNTKPEQQILIYKNK